MIRKITLLLLSALAFIFVDAQTFTPASLTSAMSGTTADPQVKGPVLLTNNTNDTLDLFWERFYENIPTGWDLSSCDPSQCNPPGVFFNNCALGTDGLATDYINVHFYPYGNAGFGEAKTRVVDVNSKDSVEIHFTANIVFVGVDDPVLASVEMKSFPNPSSETTFINYSIAEVKGPFEYRLLDLNGRLIETKTLNQASGQIEVDSDLEAGIYIANILFEGQVIGKTKIQRL